MEKENLYRELQQKRASERHEIKGIKEKLIEEYWKKYQEIVRKYEKGFTERKEKPLSEEQKPEWFKEREEELRKKIEILAKELGASADEIEAIRKSSFERLANFMRKRRWLGTIYEESSENLDEFRKKLFSESLTEISAETYGKAKEWEEFNRKIATEIQELPLESPESFMAGALLKIREYKEQLPSGIIETDYPQTQKEHVKTTLLKNRLAALVGETGTGKTRIAVKIAQELTSDSREGYEFIAGHKFMTAADLFSYLGIEAKRIKPEQIPSLIKEAQIKYLAEHPDLTEEEKREAFLNIEKAISSQGLSPELQSKIFYSGVLKAAKEGKIVIIDEFNYIPPALLGGLNALIEAKPGQKVNVFGEEIEVKPGFGVILTGNITKQEFQGRYLQREKIDPALINRLNSGLIEYLSLPQDTENSFTNSILSEEEIKAGKEIPQRELFQIALTILTDQKGNLVGYRNLLQDVWNLSRDFSLFQKIYGGEVIQSQVRLPDGRVVLLKDYPISNRTFLSIIDGFKKEGFKYSLDWYIYDNLLRPAFIVSPQEAGQIFLILRERGFFASSVWEVLKVDPSKHYQLSGIEIIERKKLEFKEKLKITEGLHYFSPQEIAEAFYGRKMPEFKTEKVMETKKTKEIFKKSQELESGYENIKEFIRNFEENITYFCELEDYLEKKGK